MAGGERQNISKMANILADEIIDILGWTQCGPLDVNWRCDLPTVHSKKTKGTHATDICWYYDEPYGPNIRTFVHTDLKSYAKGSITKNTLGSAIFTLSTAVHCAESSEQWQTLYGVSNTIRHEVHGLLFIYNHDEGFDKDFRQMLLSVNETRTLSLPARRRIIVAGPEDIEALAILCADLNVWAAKIQLPANGPNFSFFYPERANVKKFSRPSWRQALSIRSITAKIVPVVFREKLESSDYDVFLLYYRGSCNRVEEFTYLLDYLYMRQVPTNSESIEIVILSADDVDIAISNYHSCINRYREIYSPGSSLDKIKVRLAPRVTPHFSAIEIGFRD